MAAMRLMIWIAKLVLFVNQLKFSRSTLWPSDRWDGILVIWCECLIKETKTSNYCDLLDCSSQCNKWMAAMLTFLPLSDQLLVNSYIAMFSLSHSKVSRMHLKNNHDRIYSSRLCFIIVMSSMFPVISLFKRVKVEPDNCPWTTVTVRMTPSRSVAEAHCRTHEAEPYNRRFSNNLWLRLFRSPYSACYAGHYVRFIDNTNESIFDLRFRWYCMMLYTFSVSKIFRNFWVEKLCSTKWTKSSRTPACSSPNDIFGAPPSNVPMTLTTGKHQPNISPITFKCTRSPFEQFLRPRVIIGLKAIRLRLPERSIAITLAVAHHKASCSTRGVSYIGFFINSTQLHVL